MGRLYATTFSEGSAASSHLRWRDLARASRCWSSSAIGGAASPGRISCAVSTPSTGYQAQTERTSPRFTAIRGRRPGLPPGGSFRGGGLDADRRRLARATCRLGLYSVPPAARQRGARRGPAAAREIGNPWNPAANSLVPGGPTVSIDCRLDDDGRPPERPPGRCSGRRSQRPAGPVCDPG